MQLGLHRKKCLNKTRRFLASSSKGGRSFFGMMNIGSNPIGVTIMHEVKLFFPSVAMSPSEGKFGTTYVPTGTMLMPSKSRSPEGSFNRKNILAALRLRGALHAMDAQLDIEEDSDHSGGNLNIYDAITGDYIVGVMW